MPSLKQLQYFLDLAAKGNMTRLAEESYVSQTALSNALARLEDELDVRLFDRIGRNLVLNEYGKVYRQHVEAAFEALRTGNQALANMVKQSVNSISLAITSSILWRDMISAFMGKYPEYTIFQRECNIDAIGRALPQLDMDFIIAGDIDFSSPHLDYAVLTEFAVRLYVPANHPLAKRKSIRLSEAKNERFICQPPATGFSRFSKILFDQAGFVPDIVAECDYTLRWDLLRKEVGVVLSCDLHVNNDNGVPILVTDDFAIRRMALFWARNRKLPPAALDFRNFIIDYYRNN
ncbi:LysR family transcriptional regulator [Desulfovibrio sp. OttesenSCG-928-O18]|nr:LysR family transcriptional regulator [Desulfovibrio sp. OttesenSCG-928-O18]